MDQKGQFVIYSIFSGKEYWMAEQVAQMLNEKCKVLETLSKCQQEVGINKRLIPDRMKHFWD